jgi:hypothetical protein
LRLFTTTGPVVSRPRAGRRRLTSSGSHLRLRWARSRSYRTSRSSASRRVSARPSRLAALDGHRWTGAASDRSVAGRRSQEQGRTATAANGLFERVIVAALFAAGSDSGSASIDGRLATRQQKEGDRETRLGYRDPRIDEACARYPCSRAGHLTGQGRLAAIALRLPSPMFVRSGSDAQLSATSCCANLLGDRGTSEEKDQQSRPERQLLMLVRDNVR